MVLGTGRVYVYTTKQTSHGMFDRLSDVLLGSCLVLLATLEHRDKRRLGNDEAGSRQKWNA